MSIPITTPWKDEGLQGALYTFLQKGDTLPMHSHDEATNHITIVVRGSIVASGDNWQETGTPRNILSFVAGMPHEIVAQEDDTKILNIIKRISVSSIP